MIEFQPSKLITRVRFPLPAPNKTRFERSVFFCVMKILLTNKNKSSIIYTKEVILLNKEIYENKTFEAIKHIGENGIEYWYARELQLVLEYKQWRRFEQVIDKAKEACKNSDINLFEHFADVGKLSKRANNAEVTINDYKLTRYACYLIAQNGDPRKETIALAQTYFAIQTRKQEISEKEYCSITIDVKQKNI